MTLTMFPLYPFQRECLDAIQDPKWKLDGILRVAVELPTGSGKTVCFAHGAVEYLKKNPDRRVIVLVHTDELVDQAYKRIKRIGPHLDVGIVKAARNDVRSDVIVASVPSLRSDTRKAQIRNVGQIIVDECHHAPATSYMNILKYYGCFDGRCEAVGYTATLMRNDGKPLVGDNQVWQTLAFQRDISWMVRHRYLIPPKGKAVEVPDLDLRKVKSTRADFREGELGEALAESLAPELVAKAWLEHAADRKTVLFAPTVASARVFAEAFNDLGIGCELVHGAMPLGDERNPAPGTRRRVMNDHKLGKFPVLANCMIATEGYDDPEISCVIIARPTKSKGLYIQIVGRGLRVDPARPYEEQDCLLLDVVGANSRHDLRSMVVLSNRDLKEEDAHSGKTLTELEDEFDAGLGVPEEAPEWYSGPVVVRDFDPLAAKSNKVWLKTNQGNYFVPAGKQGYVFIMQYPVPGEWSVAWCTTRAHERIVVCLEDSHKATSELKRHPFTVTPGAVSKGSCDCKPKPVAMTIHRGLPLDQAMVWAEDLAVDMGATTMNLANKKASWRSKVASEAMTSMAKNLGLKVEEETDPETGITRTTERAGKLSDRITKVVASRRIDPLVKSVQEKMR